MEKPITKKRFQELLNAMDKDCGNQPKAIIDGYRHNQYHQSKRLYGDYLRTQDPGMFDANYREYLNGQHQHLNKYL